MIQAWGQANYPSIGFWYNAKAFSPSTLDAGFKASARYEYLGAYFVANYTDIGALGHYGAVFDSHFAALPRMLFSPKEIVGLVNPQLASRLGRQDYRSLHPPIRF